MSKVQILLVNPERQVPTKSGGTFAVQDVETVILSDAGEPVVVGPLALPRDLIGKIVAGTYDGHFQWERDYKTGRLVSSLVGLTPLISKPSPAVIQKV